MTPNPDQPASIASSLQMGLYVLFLPFLFLVHEWGWSLDFVDQLQTPLEERQGQRARGRRGGPPQPREIPTMPTMDEDEDDDDEEEDEQEDEQAMEQGLSSRPY